MTTTSKDPLQYPFDAHHLLKKKRSLKRKLLEREGLLEKRIAVLGGSTTDEICSMLELFLLREGIKPAFHQSEYGRYWEDLQFENPALEQFKPDLIFIHTTSMNLGGLPGYGDSPADAARLLDEAAAKFAGLWDAAAAKYGCPVIQNNFDPPRQRPLGNLEFSDHRGAGRHVAELNRRFAEAAAARSNLYINDIHHLASWFGLERWQDRQFWHSYKYAMAYEAVPHLAHSLAAIVLAIYGKSRKCLVLDLDNTLWGGVIGDDGVKGIRIGRETALAEAYTEFQTYVKKLKERGVILAVCSKNEMENALAGLNHPDSVLRPDDFSVIKADWEPKHLNVAAIAETLNIGLDSLVFFDDNPAERELVASRLPQVAVPDLGDGDVARYIDILEGGRHFETVGLSEDDLKRSRFYEENAKRGGQAAGFGSHDDFLDSLEMVAEIKPFAPVYLERIAQLTNKTNQFNLTTRRYTQTEIAACLGDAGKVTLYGKLTDKFGANGLISVVVGSLKESGLHLDLWLMSCRVLKRGMEQAMFDALARECRARGVEDIWGYYYPTAKNVIVSGLYGELGFLLERTDENGGTVWRFPLDDDYQPQNRHIRVEA